MKPNLKSALETRNFFQLLLHVKSDEVFCFKSKYSDLFYLGIKESPTPHSTFAFIGNFEGDHQKKFYQYNLLFKEGKLTHNFHEDLFDFDLKLESKNTFQEKVSHTTFEEWSEKIHLFKEEFKNSHFVKLVLSRDTELKFENLNEKNLIADLLRANNEAENTYFIYYKNKSDSFISFTPEMFITKNNEKIESISLASSMPKTEDAVSNLKNEDFLLTNQKLIDEHTLVTLNIASVFKNHIGTPVVSPVEIMKLSYIMHRMQKITASHSQMSIDEIVKHLHPTPAVGAMPRENGILTINKIEHKKRNYYAAPFGVVFDNNGELAVALRSGTIKGNSLILHSGCGIINESDPLIEWNETENKMKPFLKAIQ